MESSSVYMCFPCYQEFDTLEEVLKHQLTCTAGEEQVNASGATAVTIPVMQAQQNLINISRTIAVPQIQVQTETSTVQFDNSQTEADEAMTSDQPRILYQCGDCDELFKTLELWQKHRKEEACRQPDESQSKPDSQPEEETVAAQGALSNEGPEGSPNNLKPQPPDKSPTQEESEQVAEPVSSASVETHAQSSDPPPPQEAPSTSNTDDWSLRRRGANKKPKPEPVLLCVDCGSCFGLVSELVAHRKTQHGFEEALHRCTVCGESFLNTTLFLYHRKQHRQLGEMLVVPDVTQKEGVGTHNNGIDEQGQDATATSTSVSSTFPQPELFLCTACGQSFSSEQGLVAHREQKHDLKRPLHTCALCGSTFMNTTKYLYHCREHRLKTSTEEGNDADEGTEVATTKTQAQSGKRLLFGSALGSPVAKRSRPIVRILKGAHARKEKEETEIIVGKEGYSVELKTNHPPPAKLLQDWSRTPLPHVCPYCGKTFTRRVFLRTHVHGHTGEKLFTCKLCMKSFTNSQSLLRHSISHTGHRPYSCDSCGKCFSQLAVLNRHRRIHMATHPRRRRGRKPVCVVDSDGLPHLFACPHCPSRFATESQLNDHKLFHTSHPFPCPECGQAFTRRKELDLHSLTHQDKQPAACPHCSSQFVNQSVLEIHLQRCPITEEERNAGRGRGQGRGRSTGQLECDLCGHRCMTQEGLELHRLSHTGQTPLKCPVRPCRRRFTSNGALEAHVLAHFQGTLGKSKNKTRFRCQICQKEFAYNSTFTVHMRTHTDERPYQCSTCNKRFRQLPHLQDHERIHSGLRPFCCWICGKSFSVAARLTEHARTHSGEKPYPCPHCMAAFRSRSNLDKHMRLHEDIETETSEQAMQAAEVAQVQKVLEGATVLSSLASTGEVEAGAVQTIYVLQGAEGGSDTVMIPSDQLSGMEGASQVVILPSSVLGAQAITVPTITMDGNEITMVEQGQSPQHTIEFIVEETV